MYCGIKDTDRNEMFAEIKQSESGKSYRKYLHIHCHDKYIKQQRLMEKENKAYQSLCEYVAKIHDITTRDIHIQYYQLIQDLRNGNVLFGKVGEKRYKQGYTWRTIGMAYQLARKDIEQAKRRVNFEGTMAELKYGLAIVRDKLPIAEKRLKKQVEENTRQELREQSDQHLEDIAFMNEEVKFKKKKVGNDISDFID